MNIKLKIPSYLLAYGHYQYYPNVLKSFSHLHCISLFETKDICFIFELDRRLQLQLFWASLSGTYLKFLGCKLLPDQGAYIPAGAGPRRPIMCASVHMEYNQCSK